MIEGLHEVIVYVDDMAKQVEFYRDTLGLEISFPADADDYGGHDWVAFDTGGCTLALHSGGSGQAVESSAELVFEVDSIDSARKSLLERGVDVGEIRSPTEGIQVAGARDPEGNPFSIESTDWD